MAREVKFASREIFEQMLEWGVMPTFDLVVIYGNKGVISGKRKIPPYKGILALPGLRQYKGEKFRDTLERIARDELGLKIDPKEAKILEQYDGFFTTECNRQDITTGYWIKVEKDQKIKLNQNHFSSIEFIKSKEDIPKNMGAMYKFHLNTYFNLINK